MVPEATRRGMEMPAGFANGSSPSQRSASATPAEAAEAGLATDPGKLKSEDESGVGVSPAAEPGRITAATAAAIHHGLRAASRRTVSRDMVTLQTCRAARRSRAAPP